MRYRLNDWFILESNLRKELGFDSYYDNLVPYVVEKMNNAKQHISKGKPLFRARIIKEEEKSRIINKFNKVQDNFYGFSEQHCLAPKPTDVKKVGRVNDIRESVLYLADDFYTALAEVRPGKKQHVSIAEIELIKDARVFEFKFSETLARKNDIEEIYHFMALSFYLPINDNTEDYSITRYIAHKLKEMGFDGVSYSSSLSETGMNIAIFDPENSKANWSKVYLPMSILYYAEEIMPRKNDERLFPKSITAKFSDDEINYFFARIK